uniref:Uncharacterized protein n=1 Tax=Macrostomum lignano TaxID=282301 RepID=A0A1I8F6L9_9PLAT
MRLRMNIRGRSAQGKSLAAEDDDLLFSSNRKSGPPVRRSPSRSSDDVFPGHRDAADENDDEADQLLQPSWARHRPCLCRLSAAAAVAPPA